MQTPKSLSVVVPVFNEEQNLPLLAEQIAAALEPAGRPWEVVFVDDGSTDHSLEVLRQLAASRPQFRYLSFARNAGQSAAFKAGFDAAAGALIVTMDADLQNDPADMPAMLSLYDQGYDMVIGWRQKRQDVWIKRFGSRLANAVRNRLTAETVRDTGCSLKVLRADMAKRLPMFSGMHRFLPTLMKLQGARVAEIRVNHRPREHGVSKYGTWDRLKASLYDLFAVRWMQRRWVNYQVAEERGEGLRG